MLVDSSEEFRDKEESSFHYLLAASRLAVGAVSHEVRNVCGAIAVVHENLARSGLLAQNKDFEALGNLVIALERIADVNLRQTSDQAAEVDLLVGNPAKAQALLQWKATRGLQDVVQTAWNWMERRREAVAR